MSYMEESKQLLDKMYENEMKIRKKYKGQTFSQLDGSPETQEIEKNIKRYLKELSKIKSKYGYKDN